MKIEQQHLKTMDELRAWLTLCITDAFPMERIIQITASAYLTILEMITEREKNDA